MLSLRNIRLLGVVVGFLAVMLTFCFSNLVRLLFNGCFRPKVVPFSSRLRKDQHDTLSFYFYHPKGNK